MYSLTWTCKFPSDNDTCYFAHCYPYTYSDLQVRRPVEWIVRFRPECSSSQDYLNEVQNDRFKSQYCKQKILCRTLAGNFVYMLTITSPTTNSTATSYPASSAEHQVKKGVVVTGRVHPGETNASWMMKGLLDFLLGDSADARVEHFHRSWFAPFSSDLFSSCEITSFSKSFRCSIQTEWSSVTIVARYRAEIWTGIIKPSWKMRIPRYGIRERWLKGWKPLFFDEWWTRYL